jgi:putative hemin transport protein
MERTVMETETLATRWEVLRTKAPSLRTRDAAARLGVSEAELVATTVGATAMRLDTNAPSLLHALPEVGRCMALTRNEHAVSEVRGRYGGIDLGAHAGAVIGEHIDLRVFLSHWRHTFAVDEPHPHESGARRRSIHVFDQSGTAVHKIFLEPEGDSRTWDAIVASRTATLPLVIEPAPAKRRERADAEVIREAFLADWDAMTDTHEFFHLLAKHGLTRTQALRIAGVHRGRRVTNDAMTRLLHEAAATGTRIMIFIGNRGCLQVFSGMLHDVVKRGPWLEVLDPGFNLHLREDKITSSWVVSKPTRAGVVSSLELYDADGETIAMVFRKRDDRECPEDAQWRGLLDRLEDAR